MQDAMNATELARALALSKGRISQLVADGTLAGCYKGDGRRRRFDLKASAEALGRKLDPGQRLGNGAASAAATAAIARNAPKQPARADARKTSQGDGRLEDADDDRYKLARTQKAEEETRRIRRQNAIEEGTYVHASSAGQEAARLLGAEISGFETVLRDGARSIADELGVDFKTARTILLKTWRAHRADRAVSLEAESAAAGELLEAEAEHDI